MISASSVFSLSLAFRSFEYDVFSICLFVCGNRGQECSLLPSSSVIFNSSTVCYSPWWGFLSDPVLSRGICALPCVWWALCRINFFALSSVIVDL